MLFKGHFQGTVFDSNCVEMDVKAIDMDYEDGKLQNDISFVSIEKSRDGLFTSGNTNLSVYVI